MSNISIRKKLLISFQVIIIITALAGIVGLIGLNSLWRNEMEMVGTATNRVYAKELEVNLAQQHACYNAGILDINAPDTAERYIQMLGELDAGFLWRINYLQENILKPESREYVATIEEAYQSGYVPKRDQLIAALQSRDAATARRLSIELEKNFIEIQEMGKTLSEQGAAHMGHVADEDTKSAILLITMMSIITILAITSSIMLGSFLFQAEQESSI